MARVHMVVGAVALVAAGAGLFLMAKGGDTPPPSDEPLAEAVNAGTAAHGKRTSVPRGKEGAASKATKGSPESNPGNSRRSKAEAKARWLARRAAINRKHASALKVSEAELDTPAFANAKELEKWRQDPRTDQAIGAAMEQLMPLYAECLALDPAPAGTSADARSVSAKVRLLSDPDTGMVIEDVTSLENASKSVEVRECLRESLYTLDFPDQDISLREGLEFALEIPEAAAASLEG